MNRTIGTFLAMALILAAWGLCPPAQADDTSATPLGKSAAAQTSENRAVKKYRDQLREERQVLEKQAERQFAGLENLYNRALDVTVIVFTVGGVIVALAMGLFFWWFGNTKKELRSEVKAMIETEAKNAVDLEAQELRRRWQWLKGEIDDLNAYKTRRVVWVSPTGTGKIAPFIQALHAYSISHVDRIDGESLEQFNLEKPDLVILSFDGTDNSKGVLERIVALIRNANPPIPLLIFTYSYGGPQIWLKEDDFDILKGFDWYVPSNIPATLISQTIVLLGRSRTMFS